MKGKNLRLPIAYIGKKKTIVPRYDLNKIHFKEFIMS